MLVKSARKYFSFTQSTARISTFFKKTIDDSNEPFIYNHMLLKLNKESTLKVLEYTDSKSNLFYRSQEKLIVLDKVSETLDSETHKVLDIDHKCFYLTRTMKLHSVSSWKQANLMMRRYYWKKDELARIRAFQYNDQTKELKIQSEMHFPIIRDFAFYRKKNNVAWNKAEIRALVWHLLKQINELRDLGAKTNYLRPSDMFFDSVQNTIKVFEHPGSHLETGILHKVKNFFKSDTDLEVAMQTLVQIIDPYVAIDNSQEAKAYLKTNFSDLLYEFEDVKKELYGISKMFKGRKRIISDHIDTNLSLREIFCNDPGFDQALLSSLKKELEKKCLDNFEENWITCLEGLGKLEAAIEFYDEYLKRNIENYGSFSEKVANNYLDLAKLHYKMGNKTMAFNYFRDAIDSMPLLDEEIKRNVRDRPEKFLEDYQKQCEELYLAHQNSSFKIEMDELRSEKKYLVLDLLLVLLISLLLFQKWKNSKEKQSIVESSLEKIFCEESNKEIAKDSVQNHNETTNFEKNKNEEKLNWLLVSIYFMIATAGIVV